MHWPRRPELHAAFMHVGCAIICQRSLRTFWNSFHAEADHLLAFRLACSGLAVRGARRFAEAAACPASDFARDAALLALAARAEGLSRDAYHHAVDAGDLVVAHVVRGAIHALAPGDFALYGRALIARDDGELGAQLGRQVQRLAADKGFAPSEALEEVATATKDALANGRRLDKTELHEELRQRVRAGRGPGSQSLMPTACGTTRRATSPRCGWARAGGGS